MPYEAALVLLLAIGVWQLFGIRQRLNEQAAQLQALLRHLGITPGQLAEPTDDIKAMARQPERRIEAIKAYRQQTGAGLKEAKDVIDRFSAP